MSFSALMYHELREPGEFNPNHPSHIDVKQDYDDILPSPLFTTVEQFEEQMAYLHNHQYHTLSLDEVKAYYYQGESIPEKSVLLTFDDCFQSMKKYAYPILKKYDMHAVAFVVSGWLHEKDQEFNPDMSICLTKQDLVEMDDVFEYANHTDSFHQRTNEATSLMMEASDEAFSHDLDICNQVVSVKDVFAYPFGLFEERNVTLLRKKGFQLAFTCEKGHNSSFTDPLLLKRNTVTYFLNLEGFKRIIK
ncbi:polysaccharide deacetylase family protein [Bacillus sp. PS06]|uniref:polysaccharide deacetylase family protein n=1 Tax=Bacillus sp. PS06 TaxID=2764176 RepID=UPI001783B425|nr:polysaccharide deacetylase family protein [Bacillus sp. PS06]MBD8069094.1 polysaccharide deacetylase family protein [Bacillus sp. PS06]